MAVEQYRQYTGILLPCSQEMQRSMKFRQFLMISKITTNYFMYVGVEINAIVFYH